MLVYFLLITFIMLPSLITGRIFKFDRRLSSDSNAYAFENKKLRRYYVCYCAILVFTVSGFRDFSVGTDTWAYIEKFNGELGTIPIGAFLSSLVPHSLGQLIGVAQSEVGFTLYNIILNDLGVSDRVFLLTTSLFCTFVFARFIYLYSSNIGLSFVVHITFGAFNLSLSGIRQFIAICFVLLAFEQMKKRSLIKYIIFVILAASFHYSAIVVIPIYLLNFLRENKRIRTSTLILVPTAILGLWVIFQSATREILWQYSTHRYQIGGYFEDAASETNILVYIFSVGLFLVCLAFLLLKRERKNNDDLQWVILAAGYVITTLMSSQVYMAGRLSYYFLVFYIAFLPNAISRTPKRWQIFAVLSVLAVGIAYFAITVPGSSMGTDTYKFAW